MTTKNSMIEPGKDTISESAKENSRETTPNVPDEDTLKKLAAFAENNPAPVLQIDTGGRILAANLSARLLFEVNLIGKSVYDKLPKIERAIQAALSSTGESAVNKPGEITLTLMDEISDTNYSQIEVTIGKNTYLFTVRLDESKSNIFIYGADITSLKRAEEQSAIFRKFAEASGQGQAMAKPDGEITYINPTLCRILGEEKQEEVVGNTLFRYYPDEYMKRMNSEIIPTVMKKGQWTGELALKSKNGNITPTLENIFLIRDEKGNPLCLANIIMDISERKAMENEIMEHTHKLGERIKELNCLYSMSELIERENTPLDDVIQGTVDLIPPSWQYPDMTCARIIMEGREFKTSKFVESEWKQACEIAVGRENIGTIEVYYTKQTPEFDEGPFLKEERSLIKLIAERLGTTIERIRFEEVLSESEEKFRSISDSANDAVIMMDPHGNTAFWNKSAEKMFGYSQEETIGKNLYQLIVPEKYHAAHNSGLETFLQNGAGAAIRNTLELTGLRSDSSEFPIELSLSSLKLKDEWHSIGIIRDITDRKNSELELQESEEKYRMVIENANEGIFILQDNKIKFHNTRLSAMSGYNDDELASLPFIKFIHKGDREFISKVRNNVMRGEEFEDAFAIRIVDKGGNTIWVQVTVVIIKWEARPASLCFLTDVTDQYKSREQLLQSDKLAAIGTLAAGVAHEINNPIGYVNSNLNTMHKYIKKIQEYIDRSSDKESDEFRNILDITTDFDDAIKESIEGASRVKNIVADLKSFSRVDRLEKENADINEGIGTTLNIVWNELKYHCKVEKDYGQLPDLYCMPNQLNQVFMNLLLNAGQSVKGENGLIRIKTSADQDNIYIAIRDNGCGIPEKDINKIFEPFFTTKDVGKGTGLGLSLVFDIIRKHNGKIDVTSEVGVGSEFIITLPLGGIDG